MMLRICSDCDKVFGCRIAKVDFLCGECLDCMILNRIPKICFRDDEKLRRESSLGGLCDSCIEQAIKPLNF